MTFIKNMKEIPLKHGKELNIKNFAKNMFLMQKESLKRKGAHFKYDDGMVSNAKY